MFSIIFLLGIGRAASSSWFVIIFVVYLLLAIFSLGYFVTGIEQSNDKEKNEAGKEKLFRNNNSIKIIPRESSVTDIYISIVDFLEVIQEKRYFKNFSNYTRINCEELIKQMIQKSEISFTAELLDNHTYIGILYKGEKYNTAIKWSNYGWFRESFEYFIQ